MTTRIPNVRPGARSGAGVDPLVAVDPDELTDEQMAAAMQRISDETGIPLHFLTGGPGPKFDEAVLGFTDEDNPPHPPPDDLPEIPDDVLEQGTSVAILEWIDSAGEDDDLKAARVQAALDREAAVADGDRDDDLILVLTQNYGGTYSSPPDPAPAAGGDAQADGESPPAT